MKHQRGQQDKSLKAARCKEHWARSRAHRPVIPRLPWQRAIKQATSQSWSRSSRSSVGLGRYHKGPTVPRGEADIAGPPATNKARRLQEHIVSEEAWRYAKKAACVLSLKVESPARCNRMTKKGLNQGASQSFRPRRQAFLC